MEISSKNNLIGSAALSTPLHEQQAFVLRVSLVNDFEALGYGIPLLDPSDLVVLNDKPVEDKVIIECKE